MCLRNCIIIYMIYFFSTALISFGMGVCLMKSLQEFFRREEVKELESKKIIGRKLCFKYLHVNFWALQTNKKTVEFWAFPCPTYTQSNVPENGKWYLGKCENGEIVECQDFYGHSLPWSVQKGGARLFEEWDK